MSSCSSEGCNSETIWDFHLKFYYVIFKGINYRKMQEQNRNFQNFKLVVPLKCRTQRDAIMFLLPGRWILHKWTLHTFNFTGGDSTSLFEKLNILNSKSLFPTPQDYKKRCFNFYQIFFNSIQILHIEPLNSTRRCSIQGIEWTVNSTRLNSKLQNSKPNNNLNCIKCI